MQDKERFDYVVALDRTAREVAIFLCQGPTDPKEEIVSCIAQWRASTDYMFEINVKRAHRAVERAQKLRAREDRTRYQELGGRGLI